MEMTRQEIVRLNKAIDEVPDARITKKMKIRAQMEPAIAELTKRLAGFEQKISNYNLNIVEIQKKVGPLIYISRAFNIEIDAVVKYLILIFVLVFDPLAICLVIASSQAINSRSLPVSATTLKPKETHDKFQPSVSEISPSSSADIIGQQNTIAPDDPYAEAEIIEMTFEDAEKIKKTS
jgi:hypothetical protein